MKKRILIGGAVIVFGLLFALGPQFLFKVCPVMRDMIMKCHWSAQAETGARALIAALGIACPWEGEVCPLGGVVKRNEIK
jgi:hypothetical protein